MMPGVWSRPLSLLISNSTNLAVALGCSRISDQIWSSGLCGVSSVHSSPFDGQILTIMRVLD